MEKMIWMKSRVDEIQDFAKTNVQPMTDKKGKQVTSTDQLPPQVTRRDRDFVDFTRSHVKNISELTNLMKMPRIEGYNGK